MRLQNLGPRPQPCHPLLWSLQAPWPCCTLGSAWGWAELGFPHWTGCPLAIPHSLRSLPHLCSEPWGCLHLRISLPSAFALSSLLAFANHSEDVSLLLPFFLSDLFLLPVMPVFCSDIHRLPLYFSRVTRKHNHPHGRAGREGIGTRTTGTQGWLRHLLRGARKSSESLRPAVHPAWPSSNCKIEVLYCVSKFVCAMILVFQLCFNINKNVWLQKGLYLYQCKYFCGLIQPREHNSLPDFCRKKETRSGRNG